MGGGGNFRTNDSKTRLQRYVLCKHALKSDKARTKLWVTDHSSLTKVVPGICNIQEKPILL